MKPNHYHDRLVRCLKLIELFKNNHCVHQLMVADALGVCRVTAQRWIDAASTIMPITEENEKRIGPYGKPMKLYRLIK